MNKLTQKRNAKFKAATKAERAVMVAKDALRMLDKGKTVASPGDWVKLPDEIFEIEGGSQALKEEDYNSPQICDLSDESEFTDCKVCALGSLMLSEIRHTNKLTLEDLGDSIYGLGDEISYNDFGHRLDKVFSYSQQKLMEYAFEGGTGLFEECDIPKCKVVKLEGFYQKYPDDEDRLRAILKNVIKNKGVFVV